MQKRNSNSRIQIASREKRAPGKSLNINHNKKLVKKKINKLKFQLLNPKTIKKKNKKDK